MLLVIESVIFFGYSYGRKVSNIFLSLLMLIIASAWIRRRHYSLGYMLYQDQVLKLPQPYRTKRGVCLDSSHRISITNVNQMKNLRLAFPCYISSYNQELESFYFSHFYLIQTFFVFSQHSQDVGNQNYRILLWLVPTKQELADFKSTVKSTHDARN